MILAGDIGGTKTLLALFETGVGSLEKVRERAFRTRDFPDLAALCARFLDDSGRIPVHVGCFGVPGAVVDGACRATNLPWALNERDLATALGIPRVSLLNDMQATALGVLALDDTELAPLNPGRVERRGRNIAVLAAGTGLGEGLLTWDGETHVPVASEGGHADFAPQDDVDVLLWRALRQRHGGHASWERVLSGAGLVALYGVLRDAGVAAESGRVAQRLTGEDPARAIGLEAVNGTDRLCEEAVRRFGSLLGAEAGNCALQFLATGGVFIAGAMAPQLWPVWQAGGFVAAFRNKGRLAGLLERIPVHVVRNDRVALHGAARWAATSDAR